MTELTILCLVALTGLLYMSGLFDELLHKEIVCKDLFMGPIVGLILTLVVISIFG